MAKILLGSALAVLAFLVGSADAKCSKLELQEDFNITEYLRATWYVQKQQKNGYQPLSSLICVAATYNDTYHGQPEKVPFFGGRTFTVFNNCRRKSKDGEICNDFKSPDFKRSFGIPLCGRVSDPKDPARISVAPCPLPQALAGNYWVAAAGPSPDNYEWAIVTAGQPNIEKSDGCTVDDTCTNPAQFSCGLWFFARKPVAEKEVMAALMAAAKKKEISTQLLLDVDQTGCQYDGFVLKPEAQEEQRNAAPMVV